MKKQISRLLCAALVFTMAMSSFAACGQGNDGSKETESKYNEACALIANGDYEGAYAAFKALGDYKDSQKHLSRFVYFPTVADYVLYDRSGVMTVELGVFNLPSRLLSVGTIGTKDGSYTYDEQGNLMQQGVLYNGTWLAYDYTYDTNNNLIKAVYTEEEAIIAVHEYEYDADGVLIRESYAEGDVVYYDYKHSYDENGNMISSVFNSPEGDHVYTYGYDEAGNMISERGEIPGGHWYTHEYTYNDAGQLIQKVRVEDGEPSYTCDYTYDSGGNCIKEETTYPDETKEIFTQEYDANGNVKKEVRTYPDGTVESVEWQYALTYITIDVPAATMRQLMGIFKII